MPEEPRAVGHPSKLLSRFQGPEGKPRLVTALADQELVRHERALARDLALHARLVAYDAGQSIFREGAPGRGTLFFILSGACAIVNGSRTTASLRSTQSFGEFPILDPGVPHSVTVKAVEPCVIALVPERTIVRIAARHPSFWRNMAGMLAARLRSANGRRADRVFVCHSSDDVAATSAHSSWLRRALGPRRVFVDNVDIAGGTKWAESLDDALSRTAAMVVLCSRGAVLRPWVNFEVGTGWARTIPVIPICFGKMTREALPEPLKLLQAVDLNGQGACDELIARLAKTLDCRIPSPASCRMASSTRRILLGR